MRFSRIGLTALATAAALTLGGCISVGVTSEEARVVDPFRQVVGPIDRACGQYSDEMIRVLCWQDHETTNAVLGWSDVNIVALERAGVAGMPILLKDNIETADMPTTAGSLALIDNAPGRDAPLVARLRDAGAVILGKTNLS